MGLRTSMMVCVALLSVTVTVTLAEAAGPQFVFDQPQAAPITGLTIDDRRLEPSKKGGSPGLKYTPFRLRTTPMNYLEDAAFSPSRVSLFESALAAVYTVAPQQVVLKTFDVVDVYPMRMGSEVLTTDRMEELLPAAAALLGPQPENSDFIVCLIEAEVDGRSISAAALAPYRVKPTAFRVYKDPSVVAAVKQAVSDAVRGWVEQAKGP